MIRSGEGTRGTAGQGKGKGKGARRRPGLCTSARRRTAPRPAPAPTAVRGARAALAPPAPGARRFRVVRPQPRPRRGRGLGSAAVRGPESPPHRPRTPGPGALTFIPGSAPACESRPGAHVRAVKLFFEGLACPACRKMPTEAAAGGGEEAASAFQTSQEFRTFRPNPGCPCA